MDYVTFYDVSQAGYECWWFPATGLLGVALGLLGVRYKSPLIRSPWAILIFSVIFTVVAFEATYSDYRGLSDALTQSRCSIVEGVVTDVQTLPPGGIPKAESFVVAGTRFEYSNFIVAAGFSRMRTRGGPIQDSLRARIHHFDGRIARLEIAPAM